MVSSVVASFFTFLFVAITGTSLVLCQFHHYHPGGGRSGRPQSFNRAIGGRGTEEEIRQLCENYYGTPFPNIVEQPREITNGHNLNNPSVVTPNPPYDPMKPVLGFPFDDGPTENIHSGKMCPNSNELIYKKTGECKKVGDPCGKLMKLYKDPQTNNMTLDCDCENNDGKTYRPIVYWPPMDQCFHLFDRGPCRNGEWLLIHGNGSPICVPRECPQNKGNNYNQYWFTYKGMCFQTETKGFCSGSDLLLHSNEEGPHGYLKCGAPAPITRTLAGPASDLPCKPGHKKTLNGDCSHKVSFA